MTQFTILTLVVSIALQLGAAALALRLVVRKTAPGYPWLLIAVALMLMATRRIVTLIGYGAPSVEDVVKGPVAEAIALVIAILMFQGVRHMRRVFVELRRARSALRREVSLLEPVVEQRTAELRAANRELEAFSHSVSHDLRAPLRSILGFSQVLEEDYRDRLDDGGRDALARVQRAAQRAQELVDSLLALSRLTRQDMRTGRVDLSALARSVVADVRGRDDGIGPEFAIADGLAVDGDAGMLRVLLENLVDNAIKFTANCDDPRVEIGSEQRDGVRTFFVRDNGAGFDMQLSKRLFAPFGRLHAETEFPGTGIGLATARRIVTRHRGEIWAEGAVGEGATVYFQIPDAPTPVETPTSGSGVRG